MPDLRQLAQRYGIQLSYEDATGKRRKASPDAVRAVIEARQRAIETRPAIVVWDGEEPPKGTIELEDGNEWRRDGPLPHGYHTSNDGSLVIAAPRTAHPIEGKRWGIFVPLHAVGEKPTVCDLKAWSALGGDFVATLALLAGTSDDRSPYSPSSRLSWNEQYGDLRAVANEIDLYLDFPLGVHPDGVDVRNHPQCFAKGISVGAPPDAFFTKGQNWGFPPLDPDGIRANRYEYFRAAIRHHVTHAAILRLDHVMGLHRLYWIPAGADAKDGVYVRYPSEELFAIITLESRRHRCAIVGEDLGTVPEYVPRAMRRHGIMRMFVVQYEANGKMLPDPPANAVASVNTHDMPPFAAFWRGLDIDDRLAQGLLDEKGARRERALREKIRRALKRQLSVRSDDEIDVLEALLAYLGRSDAKLVLVNPEDLWRETTPQNVPGLPERSWKQRFRLSLDEARRDANVRRILQRLNGARLASG